MAKVPEWFKKGLEDFGGHNGSYPNYRIVFAPDERWPSGVLKYPHPQFPMTPLECWILEAYAPAEFFGTPDEWEKIDMKNVLGIPFPSRGMYVLCTPLMASDGTYLDLTESLLVAVKKKISFDREWASLNEERQLDVCVQQNLEREKAAEERADKKAHEIFDHYYTHAERLSKEDDRLTLLPQKYDSPIKGGKQTLNDRKRGSKTQKLA